MVNYCRWVNARRRSPRNRLILEDRQVKFHHGYQRSNPIAYANKLFPIRSGELFLATHSQCLRPIWLLLPDRKAMLISAHTHRDKQQVKILHRAVYSTHVLLNTLCSVRNIPYEFVTVSKIFK